MTFCSKKYLVTGGAAGIGKGIVQELLSEGAEVFALDKSQDDLNNLKLAHPLVQTICADITNWEETKLALTCDNLPAFNGLVNCAGLLIFDRFLDIKERDFDAIFGVNLKGALCISQCVCQNMIKHGKGGAIVNVSSTAAYKSAPGYLAYATSKAALDHMTKGMANELGVYKIRVNSVNPGLTPETQMGQMVFESRPTAADAVPLGRWNDVKDIINSVMFLLDDSKSAQLSGVSLPVDGGRLTR